MSMQTLSCPHCGHSKKVAPVTSLNHTVCSKCHKKFSWQSENGRIITYKG